MMNTLLLALSDMFLFVVVKFSLLLIAVPRVAIFLYSFHRCVVGHDGR